MSPRPTSDPSESTDRSGSNGLKDAAKLIAEDLRRMSILEREKVLFGVHGVSDAMEESLEMTAKCLTELDTKISKIRFKEAYTFAELRNPSYVNDRNFRLHFLRSVKFDTSWAAEKLVRFFELKLELFGGDMLTKDITLDDFDEETTAVMESGLCTILPLKDRAGRAIGCWTIKLRGHFSLESRVRRCWG